MNIAQEIRILLSAVAIEKWTPRIKSVLGDHPYRLIEAESVPEGVASDATIAFLTRDVTGTSTKRVLQPTTLRFHNTLREASDLRWVHNHSSGADRPVFLELRARGVEVTTSSGANADIVAQSVLAGMLAQSRQFPRLMQAQREHKWMPHHVTGVPRDLAGQTVTLVGWGPIARKLAAVLQLLGLHVQVVRSSAAPAGPNIPTCSFENLSSMLPTTDWLVLACPLSDRTAGLVGAQALGSLPCGAHLVNVARGEIVDEQAVINALGNGQLADMGYPECDRHAAHCRHIGRKLSPRRRYFLRQPAALARRRGASESRRVGPPGERVGCGHGPPPRPIAR
jgi:lactate dehydrogenase-like 2-hydroxyacid dehydrogenase